MTTKTTTKDEINFGGIIPAIPIPFAENEQQSVDYEKLKENILKWDKFNLIGYCVPGSYGEFPLLSDEEKLQIIRTVKSSANPSKLIVAGTTCESTEQTCKLSKAAAEAGADAVMVQTPHYYRGKMTDEAIIKHFTTVADKVPVPVIIYNNPFTTSIDISLNCIVEMADHPNIRAIKDVEVFKLGCIVQKTKGKNIDVLAASAGNLLPALLVGCTGGLNGLSAALPQPLCEMYALAKANEWDKAAKIQKQLILSDLMLRETGPPGLKAAIDFLGYYGGLCRKPILPLDEGKKKKIHETLITSGYLS